MRRVGERLLITALFAGPAIACAHAGEDEPFLRSMPDLSSPRATIAALRTNAQAAYRDLVAFGPKWPPRPSVQRMIATLNTSGILPNQRTLAAATAAAELAFVLEHLPVQKLADAPDAGAVRAGNITRWRIPGTSIEIVKMPPGDRFGDFLFSAETIAMADRVYLASKQELPDGAPLVTPVDAWSYVPGPLLPQSLVQAFPEPLLMAIGGQAVWQWIGLAILLVIAVWVMATIIRWGIHHDRRETRVFRRYGQIVAATAVRAFSIATLLLAFFALKIWGGTLGVLMATMQTLAYAGVGWLAVAVTQRGAQAIITAEGLQDSSIDSQLISVVSTLLAIVIVLVTGFVIATLLGIPLGPLLAGLGIGGLAIALAVRPTLENVIGGLTLFADRSVRIGDFCRIGTESGTVEEIGLRTTKIRGLDDAVITIPNAELAHVRIANVTRRRRFLVSPTLGLRYETSATQLRAIEADIVAMLAQHPQVLDEGTRVRFSGSGDYSLNLEVFAYIDVTRMADFVSVREELNFFIMDIVNKAAAGFAFPSQTNYVARDTLPAAVDGQSGAMAADPRQR